MKGPHPAEPSRARPIVIGLTGGIGSGKSAVLRTLVALGAEGIDADRVAHQVTEPAGAAYQPVVDAFGTEILDAAGQIDRRALGRRVFDQPEALQQLESITHPAVTDAVRGRVAATRAPVVAIEAIKLIEAGLSRALCDQVWVTVARPEQQVARLVAGRAMEAGEIARRMAAQLPPAEMARHADRVIDTSGTLAETGLQVLKGWADLKQAFPPAEIRPSTMADAEGIAAVLNSVVREGGLSVVDRTWPVDEEQAYLRQMPERARITVATVAGLIVGWQEVDVYADYTHAMDHVGVLATFIAAGLRGRGLGRALAEATLRYARQAGFEKLVINVRADNAGAQAYYGSLGFRQCGRLTRQAKLDGQYVDELLYEMFL